MTIQRMIDECVFCGRQVPDGCQPELFACCGKVGRTRSVPQIPVHESAKYIGVNHEGHYLYEHPNGDRDLYSFYNDSILAGCVRGALAPDHPRYLSRFKLLSEL